MAFEYITLGTVGESHERTSCVSEDYVRVGQVNADTLFVALADGAGFAPRGGDGAFFATAAALKAAMELLKDDRPSELLLKLIAAAARSALEALSVESNCSIDDFACTLLLAALTSHFVIAVQIGDGAIVIGDENIRLLTTPMHGIVSNATFFLTDSDWMSQLQFAVEHERVNAVAMFSDGIEAQCISRNKPHLPFFEPLFRMLRTESLVVVGSRLRELFESSEIRRLSGDDITFVLAKAPQ
jgi:Protein phosphatase 2C